MKKYFVLTAASYENFENFGADIVGVLNSNFSSTSEAQELTIMAQGAKNLLTFPVSPMTGSKYIVLRATGEAVSNFEEAQGAFLLGYDGVINPPRAGLEGQEGYWNRVNNINLGHNVIPLTAQVLKDSRYFVAASGYSDSIISVEITLDRYHKPQAAICRLTTTFNKSGAYRRHFLAWAEAHGIAAKDGKW